MSDKRSAVIKKAVKRPSGKSARIIKTKKSTAVKKQPAKISRVPLLKNTSQFAGKKANDGGANTLKNGKKANGISTLVNGKKNGVTIKDIGIHEKTGLNIRKTGTFRDHDSGDDKETIEKLKSAKRLRKSTRKVKIRVPLPPPVEVSNYPKNKVRTILVSQPKPVEGEKNPYFSLAEKHNISIDFRQFISVQGLSAQEFRLQRVDIMAHGAVILTSKQAVDHYFRICNEMRITVPETMKYFCINEQTAYYLQKYIQYRKRKIFFGHGTISDLVDVIKKNKSEKFLLPASDSQKEQIVDFLEEVRIEFTKAVFYKTVAADLSDIKSLDRYDIIVFFTPVGIKSLKKNFPSFKQAGTRIAAFGHTTASTVKSLGYRLDIFAPSVQNPSMSSALEAYIREANKRNSG